MDLITKPSNMRLKKPRNTAEEEIVAILNEGYKNLQYLRADFENKQKNGTFTPQDQLNHVNLVNTWGEKVRLTLNDIFPTELESNQFLYPPHTFSGVAAASDSEYKAKSLRIRVDDLLKGLESIRNSSLLRYTDIPQKIRLFIEDIDSFSKARDINPAMVSHLLDNSGYLDMAEDVIQTSLERVLNESFHKKDWGGEQNDLYTSNVIVNGTRKATAMLLKGNGIKRKVMEIKNCGKNGDQILRLIESPADLFIIQFVGQISEAVIKDIEGKVNQLRSTGKYSCYCIMNGQDTARVLYAYGHLN